LPVEQGIPTPLGEMNYKTAMSSAMIAKTWKFIRIAKQKMPFISAADMRFDL
jgi:hypothetical protein